MPLRVACVCANGACRACVYVLCTACGGALHDDVTTRSVFVPQCTVTVSVCDRRQSRLCLQKWLGGRGVQCALTVRRRRMSFCHVYNIGFCAPSKATTRQRAKRKLKTVQNLKHKQGQELAAVAHLSMMLMMGGSNNILFRPPTSSPLLPFGLVAAPFKLHASNLCNETKSLPMKSQAHAGKNLGPLFSHLI